MKIISFEHLYKIHDFQKFQWCGLKIEPSMPTSKFQSSKLKRAWQAQFLSHALEILENDAFFKDVQMI